MTNQPAPAACTTCGGKMSGKITSGHCPACLIQLALGDGDLPTAGAGGPADHLGGEQLRLFGDYELIREIARGGMGVVYQARQISLNRPVAVKMILSGQLATPAEVARFAIEAEAAARLDHPNIVSIYECGEFETQHFYSMRYIEGDNLALRLTDLGAFEDTSRARQIRVASLVAKIAGAVGYAHRHGVLHRDLKPTNILVDEAGEPFVTDFGLAKVLMEGKSKLTRSIDLLGSPSYMAPEQAESGQDTQNTAVDVYGLGAILYELLTGVAPFVASNPLEVLRLVREVEAKRPSDSVPGIDRDLETVCLKCIEKEPARRYDSAAELVEDLERFMRGQPVLARAVGPGGRFTRWCRRNPAKAGLSAATACAVVAGAIGVSWQAVRATEAEKLSRLEAERAQAAEQRAIAGERVAKSEADRSSAMLDFLIKDMLKAGSLYDRDEPDPDLKLRTVIDNAASSLEGRFPDDPVTKGSLSATIGDLYSEVGEWQGAATHYSNAIGLLAQAGETRFPAYVNSKAGLARIRVKTGDYDGVAEELRSDIREVEAWIRSEPGNPTFHGYYNMLTSILVSYYQRRSRFGELLPLARKLVDFSEEHFGRDHPRGLTARAILGGALVAAGALAESEEALAPLLPRCVDLLGERHWVTIKVRHDLATVYLAKGQFAEAEPLLRRAWEDSARGFGRRHLETLLTLHSLAASIMRQGRYDEAEPMLKEVLVEFEKTAGQHDHYNIANHEDMSVFYVDQRKYREAQPYIERFYGLAWNHFGDGHAVTTRAARFLAKNMQSLGHPQEEFMARQLQLQGDQPWPEEKTDTLVARGSSWKWFDGQTGRPEGWALREFDDSSWPDGAAPLGYGEDDLATLMPSGRDEEDKPMSACFRKRFTLQPGQLDAQRLRVRIRRDDGAVAYLNGREIFRSNMPPDPLEADTPSAGQVGSNAEHTYYVFLLEPDLLEEGVNQLAVAVHQANPASSDLVFDFQLEALR